MDLREGKSDDAENHWYYEHKMRVVENILEKLPRSPRIIKDIGAGSGFFSKRFASKWPESKVFAVDTFYSEEDLVERAGVSFVKQLHGTGLGDLYSLMDVLEHVEDDQAMLDECVAEAASGSSFLITVPAFRILWSNHDVFLGHYRRYTLREVENLVKKAGLTLVDSRYIFAPIFFPVLAVRLLRKQRREIPRSDMKPASRAFAFFARLILSLDLVLPANKLFGVSVLVLATKSGGGLND